MTFIQKSVVFIALAGLVQLVVSQVPPIPRLNNNNIIQVPGLGLVRPLVAQRPRTIHKESQSNGKGNYMWRFYNSDGSRGEQRGFLKDVTPAQPEGIQVIQGFYGYMSPDGIPTFIQYIMDENGFRLLNSNNNADNQAPLGTPVFQPAASTNDLNSDFDRRRSVPVAASSEVSQKLETETTTASQTPVTASKFLQNQSYGNQQTSQYSNKNYASQQQQYDEVNAESESTNQNYNVQSYAPAMTAASTDSATIAEMEAEAEESS